MPSRWCRPYAAASRSRRPCTTCTLVTRCRAARRSRCRGRMMVSTSTTAGITRLTISSRDAAAGAAAGSAVRAAEGADRRPASQRRPSRVPPPRPGARLTAREPTPGPGPGSWRWRLRQAFLGAGQRLRYQARAATSSSRLRRVRPGAARRWPGLQAKALRGSTGSTARLGALAGERRRRSGRRRSTGEPAGHRRDTARLKPGPESGMSHNSQDPPSCQAPRARRRGGQPGGRAGQDQNLQ